MIAAVGSRARNRTLLALLATAALLGALEGAGFVMAPAPSGSEARTATFNDVYYAYDRDLIVRLQPSRRHDFKSIRPDLDATVSTNSSGFRGPEFAPPDPSAFRVLVLGDSVSFGFGVGDDEAWPAILLAMLERAAEGRAVQVRNLGVPGYTTSQGRLLFERHALAGDFAPQLVVFAFGFNDGFLRPHDDRVTLEGERFRHEAWAGRLRTWLREHSWFFAWVWREQDQELEHGIPRVPPQLGAENLEAVAAAAGAAGIELLLVDASLPHCYLRDRLRAVAAAHGLASLSFREVFRRHARLAPEGAWPDGGALRITVDMHGLSIPPSPSEQPDFYVLALEHPDQRPAGTRVALNDAGRDGDAVAGDGVWSCRLDVPRGASPELGFLIPGLADRVPAMRSEGLLLNGVHLQQPGPPDPAALASPPVLELPYPNSCPWPELVLLPDPIHASPAGCRLMAEAVCGAILGSAAWRAFVRSGR